MIIFDDRLVLDEFKHLPSCCFECPFECFKDMGAIAFCGLLKDEKKRAHRNRMRDKRDEFCPLIEVKKGDVTG